MSKFATHDDYLAGLPADQKNALQALRIVIHETVPEAEERFFYGVPAFYLGKPLVGYAAMKNHLGFYVLKGQALARFSTDLKPFSTDEGTVRFSPAQPIPDDLVRRIVTARLDEPT